MTSRVRKDYEEVELSTGEVVKVHRVPEAIVNSVIPSTPRPRRPTVEMETLKGKGTQERAIKEGDDGWEDYVEAKEEWDAEKNQLQEDVTLVLSLKDVDIPEDVDDALPDEIGLLIDDDMLELPTNPWSLKAFYIRATVLIAYSDELEISWMRQKLSGVPEEVIEEMKAKFRDTLYGEFTSGLGTDPGETDAGPTEAEDEDQSVG